jgi:hypothetical protein
MYASAITNSTTAKLPALVGRRYGEGSFIVIYDPV